MHIHFKSNFVLIILFFSLSFNPGFSQEQQDEMILAEYKTFQSKILEEEFTYLVDLPAGYEKTDKKYPVIYVMNSHMTSTFANAVATLRQLSSEIIPQFILVGLCNDKGRASKYFPMRPNGEFGEADTFLKFLTDEFVPYIDQNYRTENYRILMEQSNTGLFTVYSLLAKSTAFNAYIAASPSLGWCLDFIKEKAMTSFAEGNWEISSLYMNYGGKDYKDLCIDPIIEFAELLGEIAPKNFHWKVELLEQDGHVPIASLNNGLLWLFPDFWVPDEKKAKGLTQLDQHFKNLTQRYGFKIEVPEEILFDISYQLKNQKKYEESMNIGSVLMERYPRSGKGYFIFGEIHRERGEIEQAKDYYKKAVEMSPDFGAAKRRLEMLEKRDGQLK